MLYNLPHHRNACGACAHHAHVAVLRSINKTNMHHFLLSEGYTSQICSAMPTIYKSETYECTRWNEYLCEYLCWSTFFSVLAFIDMIRIRRPKPIRFNAGYIYRGIKGKLSFAATPCIHNQNDRVWCYIWFHVPGSCSIIFSFLKQTCIAGHSFATPCDKH